MAQLLLRIPEQQGRGQSEWAAVVSIRFCILILTWLILWGLFTNGN